MRAHALDVGKGPTLLVCYKLYIAAILEAGIIKCDYPQLAIFKSTHKRAC